MVNRSPLILPPGAVPTQPPPTPSGPPFDRNFFESVLPSAIQSYCSQVACTMPLVQLFTSDGARHYIRAISGVTDQWVALHTQEEVNEQPVQVFIPYATVIRVEIHPDLSPDLRRFGFLTDNAEPSAERITAGETDAPD
ncbi:MAG: hypothetical protein OXD50_06045 [Chloroflexi bacterium]|nr:hypothetical protein [Chloroflexota bacterium]